MQEAIETVPNGYTTVTAWIVGQDTAGLMDFLAQAFGAEEECPGGRIAHAEMRIGTAMALMFDAPEGWSPTPAFLRLYVRSAEATIQCAVQAGATLVTQVTHLGFGDKVGRVRDPFGNLYWIQQRVENVTGDELSRRWSDPKWLDAMHYVERSLAKVKL